MARDANLVCGPQGLDPSSEFYLEPASPPCITGEEATLVAMKTVRAPHSFGRGVRQDGLMYPFEDEGQGLPWRLGLCSGGNFQFLRTVLDMIADGTWEVRPPCLMCN